MAFNVGSKKDLFNKMRAMAPAARLDALKSSQSSGAASPFSLLTPTEFAKLFPKYYMDRLPDVKGFYDALSSKKSLSSEGKTYGPHGDTDGSASIGSNEKVTNVVRAKEIYDYLRQKGVDHTHATGIINNMKYESAFNSGAIGDHGTSGGLFQHHASRFSAMKEYVGSDWQTNWKKQVDFALTEGEMKTFLSKNYANASDASIGFTTHFEKPADTEGTARFRAGTAEGYASAMEGKGAEPAGGTTSGGSYEVTPSGFVVPKDKGMYDQKNEEQCATLSKGMNPNLGRSAGWTVVPGAITPGVTVATMRYNLPGGDRTGSGYHTGIAMSAPDKDGNFLLLEQFAGKKPQVRQVNANSYSGGAMGGDTQFGLIQSNGKLHNEVSLDALKFGATVAGDNHRQAILSNYESVVKGGTGTEAGTNSVTVNEQGNKQSTAPTAVDAPGPQSNLQQQESVKSIQTATIGDMMRFVGSMSGFFNRGEGLGDDSMDLGRISRPYESGEKGVHTISSGKKDPGGVSYGSHQLSSKKGTMAAFLSSPEGSQYATRFQGHKPGTPGFNKIYTQIATEDPKAFEKSQHEYIKRTHYQPLYEHAKKLGFNVDDPRVAETLFSLSVQHGGAKRIVSAAKAAVAAPAEEQVTALFDKRRNYVMRHKQNFDTRYAAEKRDVLGMDIKTPSTSQVAAKSVTQPPKAVVSSTKNTPDIMGLESAKAAPTETAFDRMRRMGTTVEPTKNKQPELPPGIYTAPDISKEMMSPEPIYKKDKQSSLEPKPVSTGMPQQPITIGDNPQFSSPSLARAMKNISAPNDARHFGGPNVA